MNACVLAGMNKHRARGPAPHKRTTQPSLGGRQASRWTRAVRRAEGLVDEAHMAEGSQSRGPIPPESLGKLPRHDV